MVVGVGVALVVVPRIFADRSAPVSTIDTTHVDGETPALLNAPTEIQDCVKAQIGEEAFAAIASKARVMDATEEETLNTCFRPASEDEDNTEPAVATSPSASTTASSGSGQPKQFTSTTTESSSAPSSTATSSSSAETTTKSDADH